MMIGRADGGVRIEFAAEEAGLLTVLAHQFADVVRDPELDDAPLLATLFPDAYRDDPDAASEFRRYTRDELEQRKIEAVEAISATASEGAVLLDAEAAETWARALTSIRMMVGTRLGIRADGDEPGSGPLAEIYRWLGELQWVLVDALEGP
ncbi:DUF2017 domain-containing protein [Protaetiibacter mangrovi]|uniref:DUF2017 domain-containing protein n=1 Tax=Protaetiibacter mangrovi TaxID=2970926 RepID=A0ABT1ZEA8_9MICO|nr:DUF2017 domain-containing protein [Protaetiibacter mangrovi]MCS0499043.1 DUF2017 domain-containing protein [Protaetiibacter mangrovi]TPX02091.1 DUF2017 family protein [Schumannella luteola]